MSFLTFHVLNLISLRHVIFFAVMTIKILIYYYFSFLKFFFILPHFYMPKHCIPSEIVQYFYYFDFAISGCIREQAVPSPELSATTKTRQELFDLSVAALGMSLSLARSFVYLSAM